MLKYIIWLIFIPAVFTITENEDDISQREVKPIRGVPVSRYFLYQPSENHFKCLDGSRIILYSQLNDDYCDCQDGSDEPGTSACSNAQFFCQNVGHNGNFILSSRVNDRLCDCCDGSDEYDSGITCPNICDELGKAARIEKERTSQIARKGFSKRQELALEGQALKDEKLKNVEPLRLEKSTFEPRLKELEAAKKTAEELERRLQDEHRKNWEAIREEKKKIRSAELFETIDTNKDGKVDIDELKTLNYIDTDHDGLINSDEAKHYLGENEAPVDFESFHTKAYDQLVSAKRHFEEEKKLSQELEEEKAKAEELAGDEPDDDELLAEEDRQKHDEDHHSEDDDQMPPYTEDCQAASTAAVEARRLFDEVNSKVQEIDTKIREAEEFASSDYGEDMSWAPLKGKCFERNVQQYTYVFCPFGQNTQKDVGASYGTSLGNFKNWSGSEQKKYDRQKYEDGQQCWNGPKRSTDVEIECGEEHELIEVTEPAKCEYQFVFRTPLACNDPDKEKIHEEL